MFVSYKKGDSFLSLAEVITEVNCCIESIKAPEIEEAEEVLEAELVWD